MDPMRNVLGFQPDWLDYKALAVLRAVARQAAVKIGVLWSRKPHGPERDIVRIAIPHDRLWPLSERHIDPPLFDLLSRQHNFANAAAVAKASLLGCRFVALPQPILGDKDTKLKVAHKALADVELVYLDATLDGRFGTTLLQTSLTLQDAGTVYRNAKTLLLRVGLGLAAGTENVEAVLTALTNECQGASIRWHRDYTTLMVAISNPNSGDGSAALANACDTLDREFAEFRRFFSAGGLRGMRSDPIAGTDGSHKPQS